ACARGGYLSSPCAPAPLLVLTTTPAPSPVSLDPANNPEPSRRVHRIAYPAFGQAEQHIFRPRLEHVARHSPGVLRGASIALGHRRLEIFLGQDGKLLGAGQRGLVAGGVRGSALRAAVLDEDGTEDDRFRSLRAQVGRGLARGERPAGIHPRYLRRKRALGP